MELSVSMHNGSISSPGGGTRCGRDLERCVDSTTNPKQMPRINRRIMSRSRQAHGSPARRRTDQEPWDGWKPVLMIALSIAFLDWATKALVIATIPLGDIIVVMEGRVALWHVRNPAMVLGLFGDLPLAYRKMLAGLLAIVGVILLFEVLTRAHRLLPHRRPWAWFFGGLLFGGMLGNLGERALHWGVTDFLSIGWGDSWLPPGNVADLAIFFSIPIALIVILFEVEARAQRAPPDAPDASLSTDTAGSPT